MKIDGSTTLIGIIADPIVHVRTPQLFNETAVRQGINTVCVPFHVHYNDLDNVLGGAKSLVNCLGIIVTIPYKERVLEYCDTLTETARLVGSANTLRLDHKKGQWQGGNFDGDGFVAGLRERGHTLQGKRVLLIGAGGAGKSIAYAVARERPEELTIHNRSMDRARFVIERLQSYFPQVPMKTGGNDPEDYEVVINATSLGLGNGDNLPLPVDRLSSGTLVCEAVVRDGDTPLLRAARKRSCQIHHGQYMLYGQIVQISRFLGIDINEDQVARILGPQGM